MRLLLIECDEGASGWLAPRLGGAGFMLDVTCRLDQAIESGRAKDAAAILVEMGQNCPDGRVVAEMVRSAGIAGPLVLLSGRSDWRETVASLDAGADDYIIKPVRSEEVTSRLRVAIRRSRGSAPDLGQFGRFRLDPNARCAWLDGRCLDLTRNEYRLLQLLLIHQGALVSAEEIRSELNTGRQDVSHNAIEVQIARLRKKVGAGMIRTIRNMGYRIDQTIFEGFEPATCMEACLSSSATDCGY